LTSLIFSSSTKPTQNQSQYIGWFWPGASPMGTLASSDRPTRRHHTVNETDVSSSCESTSKQAEGVSPVSIR